MRLMFASVAALLLFYAEAASAESVNCPFATATRDLTTSVPSGWYTTPTRSRLTETRVAEIGGQRTMVCVYGEAASIMREVPAGQVCTARAGGFECGSASGPTPAPESESHAAGTFTVRGTYEFDLDAGAESSRVAAEFWYEVIRDGETYFTPRRTARILAMGAREPAYADCTSAALAATRTRIESGASGTWYCFRTNEGRVGKFRLESVDRFASPRRATIRFTTW